MTDANPMNGEVSTALGQFSGDVTIRVRKAALTALLAARAVAKHADDRRFKEGRDRLLELAGDEAAAPVDRLLAIAESIRAVQTVKRLQADTTLRLQAVIGGRVLPPLSLLPEAEDRLNVARACRRVNAQWLPGYLAHAIADEDSGELARIELLNALVERSPTLSNAVAHLEQAFAALAPTTEKPAETIARRLGRTLVPLREAIVRSSIEAGDEVGEALARLVAAAIRRKVIEEPKIAIDLAQEALLTVHDIVRTRFSVATEASTFAVVGYLRSMLGGGSWPEELQTALQLLIGDVREALLLLGRQGVAEQKLLDQLQLLTNFPERARAIAKALASAHPELPENVRDWLEHGRVRQLREASSTATETVARDADSYIGLALIAVRALSGTATALEAPLMSTVDVYEPSLRAALQEHFKHAAVASAQIEDAARKRRLALIGAIGGEVDFAPKFFDSVRGTAAQRARVRLPAVARLKPDGTPGEVVVKGLVE